MQFDLIFLLFVGMALFKPLLGNLSGKVAGNVFARNKAGMYVRNWAKPTSTPSIAQTVMRAMFGAAASFWKALSPSEVNAWNDWALTQSRTNRQGDSYTPTGRQLNAELNSVINAASRFFGELENLTLPPVSSQQPSNLANGVLTATQTDSVLDSLEIVIPDLTAHLETDPNLAIIFEAAPLQFAQKYNVQNLFRAIAGYRGNEITTDTVELIMKFEEEFDTTIADPDNSVAWLRYYIVDTATGLRSPAINIKAEVTVGE